MQLLHTQKIKTIPQKKIILIFKGLPLIIIHFRLAENIYLKIIQGIELLIIY